MCVCTVSICIQVCFMFHNQRLWAPMCFMCVCSALCFSVSAPSSVFKTDSAGEKAWERCVLKVHVIFNKGWQSSQVYNCILFPVQLGSSIMVHTECLFTTAMKHYSIHEALVWMLLMSGTILWCGANCVHFAWCLRGECEPPFEMFCLPALTFQFCIFACNLSLKKKTIFQTCKVHCFLHRNRAC